ncbi:hypothetical protein GCM10025864_19970 [Luteimicrobium album]|uniref:Uncharacterized protein n=1 Tax=Luteimicrobium album TaxID=1054550 RepID=A0ABQ6I0H1_9MICO|nr:hypothetical protein GCM10025864_19970 [Luteimicrobium album]
MTKGRGPASPADDVGTTGRATVAQHKQAQGTKRKPAGALHPGDVRHGPLWTGPALPVDAPTLGG